MQKVESLQAYRGIAAILVVLYHVSDYMRARIGASFLGGLFNFGFVGVDLFFVLSGFIIFWVNESKIGRPDTLRSYAFKRLIRIYPIYWAITVVKLASIYALRSSAKDYERSAVVIVKSFLLIPQVNLPLVGAAWTLSYELLFYALFGLTILGGTRIAYLLAGTWMVGIVGFTLFAGQTDAEAGFLASFLLNERNLEFLLGCLGAYLVRRGQLPRARTLLVGGLILFVIAGISIDLESAFSPVPFAVAAFLLVVGSASAERQGLLSVPRIMVYLGDASYSIYLLAFAWVESILLLLDHIHLVERLSPQLIGVLVSILAVTGGAFVYQYVERPGLEVLRSLGKRDAVLSTPAVSA
jgi:exopolysaccharide production protein ExoZ